MRKRKTPIPTASAAAARIKQRQPTTAPLRRSLRFLNETPGNPSSTHIHKTSKIHNNSLREPNETTSSKFSPIHFPGLRRSPRLSNNVEKISNSDRNSKLSAISTPGSRKSPRFNNGVGEASCLRRSQRLGSCNKVVENCGKAANKSVDNKSEEKAVNSSSKKTMDDKGGLLLNEVKGKAHIDTSERRSKSQINVEVVMGLKSMREQGHGHGRSEEVTVTRKRKIRDEGEKWSVKGWTWEQEMALQRAYFAAKPTPQFWKKVSKQVPGKSAQECFDKVHSEHITPSQPLPRSRSKRIDSSPLGCFSLSASKLLKPSGLKIKGLSYNKRKSHLTHKTARQLLRKCNRSNQYNETDLFSILEPNTNPSTHDPQPNVLPSTPIQLQEKHGFLQKCTDTHSGRKMALAGCSRSQRMDLFSPPVLKQVRNKALHEKYIDQLHSREAKREAAIARAGKLVSGKKNRDQVIVDKIDTVIAAKNALVSDAIDAIKQFKHLQAEDTKETADSDDDHVDSGDDEGESGF